MTQVCVILQTETRNFDNELRLVRGELCAKDQECADLEGELGRTKSQLSRLIDAQIVGTKLCGRCGRPMDKYNTYVHEKTGKDYCRGCHRDRQQRYRDERKSKASQGLSSTSC